MYIKGVNANGNGGEDLIRHHSKHTVQGVKAWVEDIIVNGDPFAYDEHCEQAWDEFKEVLLNSADESLTSSV